LDWSEDNQSWGTTGLLASEVDDESSKVAYIAQALITLTWETVRLELPVLLEGIAGYNSYIVGSEENRIERQRAVNEALQVLSNLSEFIGAQIHDREVIHARGPGAPKVRETWDMWRSRAQECDALVYAVRAVGDFESDTEISSLLTEINRLGRLSQGHVWKDLGVQP